MSTVHDLDTFRTGLVGRLVRLGWALLAALSLASIVDSRGSAHFRNPHILTEPLAWLLHGLMLATFVILVGAIASLRFGDRVTRWIRVATVVAVALTVAAASALGQAIYGAVWGFPLADLVWYFDVFMLVVQLVAFILAAALGTPGCEVGVWTELIGRGQGERVARTEGLTCIVGIHLIDRWEARRNRVNT